MDDSTTLHEPRGCGTPAVASVRNEGIALPPGRVSPTKNRPLRPVFRASDGGGGGAEEDRTPDLRIANATLSQLSYRPTRLRIIRRCRARGQNLPRPVRAGGQAPVRVRRGASPTAARASRRRDSGRRP